jgi:hypothetical protein
MPSKKKSQASHARRRILARYGLVLNDQQFKELNAILAKGNGDVLCKQSLTKSIRKINFLKQDFYVVYDKKQRQVATFLTKEMAEITSGIQNLKETQEVEIQICQS